MGCTLRLGPLVIMRVINPVSALITWGLMIQSDGLLNFTLELLPSVSPHQPLSHWELEQ